MLAKSFGICERFGVTTGDKIRRAIERKFGEKISQNEAARRIGVPTGTLSEWLSGAYEPTLASLRWVAEQCECSVTSLVGDEAKAS